MNDGSNLGIQNDQLVQNEEQIGNLKVDPRQTDQFFNKAYKYGLMEQQMAIEPEDAAINQMNNMVDQRNTNILLEKKRALISMLNQLK